MPTRRIKRQCRFCPNDVMKERFNEDKIEIYCVYCGQADEEVNDWKKSRILIDRSPEVKYLLHKIEALI